MTKICHSKNLIRFFDNEINDYRDNVRMGNIDPTYGFVPTLESAFDTLTQAETDMAMDMLGVEDYEDPIAVLDAFTELQNLTWLIIQHGPSTLLTDFEYAGFDA